MENHGHRNGGMDEAAAFREALARSMQEGPPSPAPPPPVRGALPPEAEAEAEPERTRSEAERYFETLTAVTANDPHEAELAAALAVSMAEHQRALAEQAQRAIESTFAASRNPEVQRFLSHHQHRQHDSAPPLPPLPLPVAPPPRAAQAPPRYAADAAEAGDAELAAAIRLSLQPQYTSPEPPPPAAVGVAVPVAVPPHGAGPHPGPHRTRPRPPHRSPPAQHAAAGVALPPPAAVEAHAAHDHAEDGADADDMARAIRLSIEQHGRDVERDAAAGAGAGASTAARVPMEPSLFPLLIGKRRANLNHLRRTTGCRLTLLNAEGCVEVRHADPAVVAIAKLRIEAIGANPDEFLAEMHAIRSEEIHVFVDNSNIMLGAQCVPELTCRSLALLFLLSLSTLSSLCQKCSKTHTHSPLHTHATCTHRPLATQFLGCRYTDTDPRSARDRNPSIRLNIDGVASVAERGRWAVERVVFGSGGHMQWVWKRWKELGWVSASLLRSTCPLRAIVNIVGHTRNPQRCGPHSRPYCML